MYIFWVSAGIIFLIIDYKKRSKITLSLCLTCLFCAAIKHKITSVQYISLYLSPVVYLTISFLLSNIFKKEKEERLKLEKLENCTGEIAIVTRDIGKTISIDGLGEIKYKDSFWRAKTPKDFKIKAGSQVKIISKEDQIINVEPIGK